MEQKKNEGYNVDLFTSTPISDDICNICKQVCREVVETDCGHPFCRDCLETWIQSNPTCPIDRKEISTGKYHKSTTAQRRIANYKMKCPNDCKEEILTQNLETHLAEACEERKIMCAICEEGMKAKELKDHMGKAIVEHVQALCLKVNNISECKVESKVKFDSVIIAEEKKQIFFSLMERKLTKLRFELLFRGSRDGFAHSTFHQKCDERGATLTVVVSTTGRIFGGFNPRSWSSKPNNYEDCHGLSWLFSLDNNAIIMNSQGAGTPTQSIYNHTSYGPTFGGGHDLCLYNGCHGNNSSYTNLGHAYNATHLGIVYGGSGKTYLAGSYNFQVKDYEVFSVLY